MAPAPRRITHICITLEVTGGAEAVLMRLLKRLDRERWQPRVIVLGALGPLARRFAAESGLEVRGLDLNPGRPDPRKLLRLVRWLRADRPDLVQTWIYHSDLLGGLAARLARVPVVWNIRRTSPVEATVKSRTAAISRACARLSGRVPARIIVCGEAAREAHAAFGYQADKLTVIPNGFDTDRFHVDPEARGWLRGELGLPPETTLLGCVARWHPVKDHGTLLAALAQLDESVHLALCGDDMTAENADLLALCDRHGVRARCHLLGLRTDVPRVQAALDVAVLSSSQEGFPNVLGEALACGVPCVSTDVGDARRIVGDSGRVVSPGQPAALAAGVRELLALSPTQRAALGEAGRARIAGEFSLDAMVRRYEEVWEAACESCTKKTRPLHE